MIKCNYQQKNHKMTTLKAETLKIIEDLKSEDIKFLHLVDRIGFDKVINTIGNETTKEQVKNYYKNITDENILCQKDDNIDIIQRLAFMENPFMKEHAFKEFYSRALATSYKKSDYNTVYEKDVIDGSINLKEGYYKNIFNGLKIKIENGPSSIAILPVKTDRNKLIQDDKILLGDSVFLPMDQELSKIYNEEQNIRIKKQFTLYHELAHLSGSQILSIETENAFTRLKILHETHSDVCGIIKTLQENNMNQEQAIAFVNDVVYARSRYEHITDSLCHDDGNEYTEHLTHAGLFTLRDFIQTDLDYLHRLKDNEISKFSTLLTEQAHQPSNIKRLEKELGFFPSDKDALKAILESELEEGNSFLARILKHNQKLYRDEDIPEYTANQIVNDPYIKLDLSLRILKLHDKEKLMTVTSPFKSVVNHTLKDDFEFFKKEYRDNHVELSKCFDYKELKEKTSTFTVKPWIN